jgi:hypothetical protein
MAFAESVAAIGRTEGHDGTSASRTSVVVFEFPLEGHVPAEHLLRSTDSFIELGELRRGLAAFYTLPVMVRRLKGTENFLAWQVNSTTIFLIS